MTLYEEIFFRKNAGCEGLVFEMVALLDENEPSLDRKSSRALHNKIVETISGMNELSHFELDLGLDSDFDYEVRVNHAKAALLWTRLHLSIGEVLYDSFQSKYLPLFPKVLQLDAVQKAKLFVRLENQYELSQYTLKNIDKNVDYVTSNLAVKNGITGYLASQLNLGLEHAKLFQFITGHRPQNDTEIDITITNATVFFSFDFEVETTKHEKLKHSSFCDKENISRLFEKLDFHSNTERVNFPAVGKWQALTMDEAFLTDIRLYLKTNYQLDTNNQTISRTIATMCYLLPHADAESFFVHDAYGHSWQESLCEFEHLYEFLPTLVNTCAIEQYQKIMVEGDSLQALLDKLKNVLFESYLHKIDIVTNAMLSEFTADAMEYHLQMLLEAKGEEIPTSSKMRYFSLFLDLSLKDIILHINSIKNAIDQEFSKTQKTALNELIKNIGFDLVESQQIVSQLNAWFKNKVQRHFYPQQGQTISTIESNLFIQLLKIYVPLDAWAKKSTADEFQQLLLVMTTLYQSHPSKMFWQLDRFVNEFKYCS